MQARLRAALKEPLLHFIVAGGLLFGFFALVGHEGDPGSRTIIITEDQVGRLASGWAQTWQRAPSQAEIDGLIRDYVKEEVYYREGLRLGLDQGDAIVRRRIRAKIEFLARSQLETERPSEATLKRWLDQHKARYTPSARYSLDQIYFAAPDEVAATARAAQLLDRLRQGAAWSALGDTISLPRSLEGQSRDDIAREFGDDFAGSLSSLRPGVWTGPVRSGFGIHLVRVRKAEAGRPPRLEEVRQAVENDWRAATIAEREAKAYQALLDGYTVKIARP